MEFILFLNCPIFLLNLSALLALLLCLITLYFGIRGLVILAPRFFILLDQIFNLLIFLYICSQCPACISAKMHKHSIPKHVPYSSFPLELVHFDVWGPTPIVSELGHKFCHFCG